MANWRELVFVVPAPWVERWSDALLEAGALSVQSEDADADSPDEDAIYGEPGMPVEPAGWARTRLTALLAHDAEPAATLASVASTICQAVPESFETREVADQDWVRLSQSQFEPIDIASCLRITPSWHLDEASGASAQAGGREVIVLDPGLAFGTGSHPTTFLCLRWLCENAPRGQTVIDYGCGSGILAIAASKLGAAHVTGVDIDPQALESAAANARVNRVPIEIRATTDAPPGPADVVLANILASPLKVLAPLLATLVRPGGRLVLAGLLDRQADEVAAAYPRFAMHAWASIDGWTCLAGELRQD